MIINDLDGYYIVFDTKNWNTELDTLTNSWNDAKMVDFQKIKDATRKMKDAILDLIIG